MQISQKIQDKLKELIQDRNRIYSEIKEIHDRLSEKEDSENSNGGSSGLNFKIVLLTASAAIAYFSEKEEAQSKEISLHLVELVAQLSVDPTSAAMQEMRELVARATEIKQQETGEGFEDLRDKAGLTGIMAEFVKNSEVKGSLSEAVEKLKKINPDKSAELK